MPQYISRESGQDVQGSDIRTTRLSFTRASSINLRMLAYCEAYFEDTSRQMLDVNDRFVYSVKCSQDLCVLQASLYQTNHFVISVLLLSEFVYGHSCT